MRVPGPTSIHQGVVSKRRYGSGSSFLATCCRAAPNSLTSPLPFPVPNWRERVRAMSRPRSSKIARLGEEEHGAVTLDLGAKDRRDTRQMDRLESGRAQPVFCRNSIGSRFHDAVPHRGMQSSSSSIMGMIAQAHPRLPRRAPHSLLHRMTRTQARFPSTLSARGKRSPLVKATRLRGSLRLQRALMKLLGTSVERIASFEEIHLPALWRTRISEVGGL